MALQADPADYSYPQALASRRTRAKVQRPSSWTERYARRLLVSDAIVVTAVTAIGYATLEWSDRLPEKSLVSYAVLSGVVALIWMLALTVNRSRDPRIVGAGFDEYRKVLSATLAVFGALAILAAALQVDAPRSYFIVALPLGLLSIAVERSLNRHWLVARRRRGLYLSRVIVVGEPQDVRYVVSQIARRAGTVEYDVVGAVLPTGTPLTEVVAPNHSVPVVGFTDGVPSAVSRVSADAVIVAGQLQDGSAFIRRLGWQLEETSTQLVLAPGLTNIAGPRIHWRPVEGLPLMHVESPQYAGTKHVVKRAMDIVLSGLALIVLAPAIAVLAVLVKRSSPGPAFFRQQRVGRNGSLFMMIKLRTMTADAEQRLAELQHLNEGAGPLFKLTSDPRITELGRVLRRLSLDELPQFWNVFRGDMSLVGPRPPLESEVTTYDSTVQRRLYSKPGITGLWQTGGRSSLDWEESVRLDLYYVENWSITGDIVLLFRTAKQVFRPRGAY